MFVVEILRQKIYLDVPYGSLNFFFCMKQNLGKYFRICQESLNLFKFEVLCMKLYRVCV